MLNESDPICWVACQVQGMAARLKAGVGGETEHGHLQGSELAVYIYMYVYVYIRATSSLQNQPHTVCLDHLICLPLRFLPASHPASHPAL